jgi:hypothetical protein
MKRKKNILENYLNHQALNVLYDIDVQIQLVHDEHQHRNPKKFLVIYSNDKTDKR